MNIFYLDHDPARCASYHCDKHVGKMIVQHLQMMSVAMAHHGLSPALKKDGTPYSTRAYKNHPCTLWVKESFSNLLWLWNMSMCLCEEFYSRYGKEHAGRKSLLSLDLDFAAVAYPDVGLTPPAQCMAKEYKHTHAVVAYRTFYLKDKSRFASWDHSPVPHWWA